MSSPIFGKTMATVAVAAVITGTAVAPAMAQNQHGRAKADTAAVVELATSTTGVVTGTGSGSSAVVTSGRSQVTVPTTARDKVSVSSEGYTIGIGVPESAGTATAKVAPSGTVVYEAANGNAAAVQPLQDGVRVLAVAGDSKAKEFRFPLNLPRGAHLDLAPDGSVAVNVDAAEGIRAEIASFEAPWAKDAHGKPVPTQYRVEGSTLVQSVDTNSSTAFPVVADPKMTWGWVTGTLYFNRAETQKATFGAGAIASIIGSIPLPDWVKVAMGGYMTGIIYQANVAYSGGNCLKLKLVPPSMILPQVYSNSDNSYCA
ncbi:hypothetical protein ABT095_36930 [Kitasatospora sp. NPDC002227]|uniref:hypothetical protein n=1 Tax=Kitasatospora sp. NPDC002227 TaxID=3154773 RepID=UPI00331FFBCC